MREKQLDAIYSRLNCAPHIQFKILALTTLGCASSRNIIRRPTIVYTLTLLGAVVATYFPIKTVSYSNLSEDLIRHEQELC